MNSYLENLPTITGNLGDSIVIFNEYVLKPTKIEGGTRLTISRDNEVQTIDIMDGHTPQKGVDYWNDGDKEEFKSAAGKAALAAISVDATLTESGKPADSAAVGAAIDHVKQAINSMIANGTSIPANAQPNQQLVTDCDGNVGWQERTHYSHVSVMDLLPECSMLYVGDSVGILKQEFQGTPIIDEIYAVEWNGIIYQCPAKYVEMDGVSSILFGNSYMFDEEMTDIPFMVLIVPGAFREQLEGASAIVYIFDGATEATLRINGKVETVKALDPKYLQNLRGQNTIILSSFGEHLKVGVSLNSNVPFAAAWKMDDAELQTAIRVIEDKNDSKNHCAVYGVTRYESDHWPRTIQMNCTLFNDVNQGFALVIQWVDDGDFGYCSVANHFSLLPDVSYDQGAKYVKASSGIWSTQTIEALREDIGISAQTIGTSTAGKLLYIGKKGLIEPLALGDGLEIVDGVLKLSAAST